MKAPWGAHTSVPRLAPQKSGRFGFGKKTEVPVKPDQEFVICVPPFPKRAKLTQKLVSNKNIILIDLDPFIDTVNQKKLPDHNNILLPLPITGRHILEMEGQHCYHYDNLS